VYQLTWTTFYKTN